ncbi:MAG: L,D-transpeptidase family protein [Betaproteobacteria bacterium]|nr:L,D-transpeptidase family protein [Betaproteobacteria bacterium]
MSCPPLFRFCLTLLALGGLCGGFWLFSDRAGLNESSPIAPANAAIAPSLPDASGPEPQLARIIAAIEANRLDSALEQTETLLQHYPNYRLGYLIKGDLLLARAHPLPAFGAASDAPSEQIDDLRAEAIVRLQGYRHKPPEDAVPRYLLQMHTRHAIVVDTQKSRLYLYRNEDGSPRFVADYYITQGKLGANKKVEGDRRTPLGVYHITSFIPQDKLADTYGRLADQYGHGAFPLNYPNELDKLQKRTGSGIWLHGTSSDTYSRPPQASDGCVVLANPDFDQLGQNIEVGYTPVIISHGIEWTPLSAWRHERDALTEAFESWRRDWESLDTERYLTHYSPRFQSRRQNFAEFAAQKRLVNQGKTWIQVKVSDLSIFRNPAMSGQEEVVVVTFRQDYASSNLVNSMKKRQYWLYEEGRWRIFYEGEA